MSCRLMWCLFFIHCWIAYTSSEDDIKELGFSIYWNRYSDKWGCRGNILNLFVGDQFKINVTYPNYQYIHDVGRCYKSQENDFVDAAFGNDKIYTNVKVTKHSVTVAREEDWKYVCIFYTHLCIKIVNNVCSHYKKYSYYTYSDTGIQCTVTIHVKNVVIPSGYLIAGTTYFTSSGEENIYKYYDGEKINFTCFKTSGRSAGLLYVGNGNHKHTNTKSISMTMGPENDNTTLYCRIIGDKTKQVIRLKLILDENKLGFWIMVLGVVLIVLLLPFGLWILKKKRWRKNDLPVDLPVVHYENLSSLSTTPNLIPDDATYTEPYIFDNANNKASENITEEHHTYVNSQELKDELIYASVLNGESNYPTIHNNDIENTTGVNSKFINAKKRDSEAKTTVKNTKDIFNNIKNQKQKLEQIKAVEHSSEVKDIKVNNGEIISTKAQKPRIKTKKPKLMSVKSHEPKVIEPNFASVKTTNLNFATTNNSDLNSALVKNSNYKDDKLQENTAMKEPDSMYVNENTLKKKNAKKLKVKIGQDKKILQGEGNTKEISKIPECGKKSKKSSREKKEDSSNLNSKACNIKIEEENIGITYAELALDNDNQGNFVSVSTLPEYSKMGTKKHEYVNVEANTDVEPAYCEIINQ